MFDFQSLLVHVGWVIPCISDPSACYILVPVVLAPVLLVHVAHVYIFYMSYNIYIISHVLYVFMSHMLGFCNLFDLFKSIWGKSVLGPWGWEFQGSLVLGPLLDPWSLGLRNSGGEFRWWEIQVVSPVVILGITYSGIRCLVTRSYSLFPWFPLCVCFNPCFLSCK